MPKDKEETKARWRAAALKKLVGRKISTVRYLTDAEQEELEWHASTLVIILDDGSFIFPSQDDEGNGPGVIFTSHGDDLPVIPLIY